MHFPLKYVMIRTKRGDLIKMLHFSRQFQMLTKHVYTPLVPNLSINEGTARNILKLSIHQAQETSHGGVTISHG